jgi:hypothetical protein
MCFGKFRANTAEDGLLIRSIPVHPALIQLGLLQHVAHQKASGKEWMWEGLIWSEANQFGKYPGDDFKRLSVKTKVYVPRRKVFH